MDKGTYAADDAWAMHPGLIEDREMSLLGTVRMWEKWNGKADDRIRVWFGARTPGGYVTVLPFLFLFLLLTFLRCSWMLRLLMGR